MTARPDDTAREGEGHYDLLVDRTTKPHPHEVDVAGDDVFIVLCIAVIVLFALLCAAGIGLWLAGWWW